MLVHKRLWEEQENVGDDLLSPVNSPFPDRIKVEKDLNKSKHEISGVIKVPKLNLTKAKKIQEINARKIYNGDSANNENESKYIEKLKL